MNFNGYQDNELFSVVNPICEGFNTSIVQLNSTIVKSSLQIRIVLYKKGGLTIDASTEIARAVLPKLEVWADDRDINLEVSSPGVGRVFKDAYEFTVFKDEKISILVDSEWIECSIVSSDNKGVILQIDGKDIEYKYDQIHKAKLE